MAYSILIITTILFALAIIFVAQNGEESEQPSEVKSEGEKIGGEGIFVEKTVEFPYDYTLYEDHVVLEHYYGNETEVVIPENIGGKTITEIGYQCFYENKSIGSVVLHDKVDTIGSFAFADCVSLKEIINGINVKTIKCNAFTRCEKLEEVKLGNKLEKIEEQAFMMCHNLKRMGAQENLVSIEESAFWESGLEEFTFPSNTEIGDSVFDDTPWLQRQSEEFIIYGDGLLVAYTGSDSSVIIPEGVKTILGGCFDKTTAEEIYVPRTTTAINELVFLQCSDVKVYIPESVTLMGCEEPIVCPIVNSDAEITIMATKGSYAQQHAKEHGIPYEIVEPWYD